MRQRLWGKWATLALLTLIIGWYAAFGELVATQSSTPNSTFSELFCGSLNDIQHYSKHPTLDNNYSPWSGVNDTETPQPDVLFGQSCEFEASVAQGVLIVSGPVFIAFLVPAVIVALRRRRQRVATRELLSATEAHTGQP